MQHMVAAGSFSITPEDLCRGQPGVAADHSCFNSTMRDIQPLLLSEAEDDRVRGREQLHQLTGEQHLQALVKQVLGWLQPGWLQLALALALIDLTTVLVKLLQLQLRAAGYNPFAGGAMAGMSDGTWQQRQQQQLGLDADKFDAVLSGLASSGISFNAPKSLARRRAYKFSCGVSTGCCCPQLARGHQAG
jgi:hypothetical protein